MKLSPISRLLAAAGLVFALSSSEAFAQDPNYVPTVAASATGNTVAITVGHMPAVGFVPAPLLGQVLGLLSYELVAYTPGLATQDNPNIATIMLPGASAGVPLTVPAPSGIYALRVRGAIGPLKGPWSAEAIVAVGLEACVPGIRPQVAPVAVDTAGTASVAWTPVPGALGYRVHWGRSPGQPDITEVVVGRTSVARRMPSSGIFYVRVESITNGCDETSDEVAFTVEIRKRYLSEAEIINILNLVRIGAPRAWSRAHHHADPERYDYIILACRLLFQESGGTIGCNWRRAVIGDLSMDGLSVENPADGRYYFADVITGAGGPNPSVSYKHPFSDDGALLRAEPGGPYAPQGFANPFGVPGVYPELRTHHRDYGSYGGW